MRAWLRASTAVGRTELARLREALADAGIDADCVCASPQGCGVLLAGADQGATLAALQQLPGGAMPIVVVQGCARPDGALVWLLLEAGALDVLGWPEGESDVAGVASRLRRHAEIEQLLNSPRVRDGMAGRSPAWLASLRSVVEAARFTEAPVLVLGDTGTGKEQLARLIHDLGPRAATGRLVVLDCTTVASELAGSEFFGHERGAFTGAAAPRDGAFALAHRGTLFLDEVGELGPSMQAQLLRVIQEGQFKRLGSNTWQDSDFRLVCATHRDLEAAVAEGRFRADLYHRIAGWCCRTPPLAERREDILPLAELFLRQCSGQTVAPVLAPAVREWLLAREYPGNVRELRHVVLRLWHHHCGSGPITAGAVPANERPRPAALRWPDRGFEAAVAQAVDRGIGLKEIAQVAAELAVRAALEREGDNLHRAALRLGVTDRALQIRRKEQQRAAP
jgi:transcriptional regulator with GAF, ATPase, and Fis domain